MGPLPHGRDERGGRRLARLAFLPPPSVAFVLPVTSRNDCCTAHIALRMGLHGHRTAEGCRPSFSCHRSLFWPLNTLLPGYLTGRRSLSKGAK